MLSGVWLNPQPQPPPQPHHLQQVADFEAKPRRRSAQPELPRREGPEPPARQHLPWASGAQGQVGSGCLTLPHTSHPRTSHTCLSHVADAGSEAADDIKHPKSVALMKYNAIILDDSSWLMGGSVQPRPTADVQGAAWSTAAPFLGPGCRSPACLGIGCVPGRHGVSWRPQLSWPCGTLGTGLSSVCPLLGGEGFSSPAPGSEVGPAVGLGQLCPQQGGRPRTTWPLKGPGNHCPGLLSAHPRGRRGQCRGCPQFSFILRPAAGPKPPPQLQKLLLLLQQVQSPSGRPRERLPAPPAQQALRPQRGRPRSTRTPCRQLRARREL